MSKETKAVSDRLADSFNKKLQAKVSEGASTTDPKQEYSLGLRAAEQHYQTELERYRKQMKETESKMSSRLKYIEDKYKQIIDSFTVKEKEYIDWIHHLELQLADMQKAKAKKIEITQHKVANPAKE